MKKIIYLIILTGFLFIGCESGEKKVPKPPNDLQENSTNNIENNKYKDYSSESSLIDKQSQILRIENQDKGQDNGNGTCDGDTIYYFNDIATHKSATLKGTMNNNWDIDNFNFTPKESGQLQLQLISDQPISIRSGSKCQNTDYFIEESVSNLNKTINISKGDTFYISLSNHQINQNYDYYIKVSFYPNGIGVAQNTTGQTISDQVQQAYTNNEIANSIKTYNGQHKTVNIGDIVTLVGSKVADNPNLNDAYKWSYWSQVKGPNKQSWTFNVETVGTNTYSFTTITNGQTVYETFILTALASDPTHNPSIYAGEDQTISLGNSILLTARNAQDFSGYITSYEWYLNNQLISTSSSVNFIPEQAGEYKFIVNASDQDGNRASDYIYITVTNAELSIQNQIQNYIGINNKILSSKYTKDKNGIFVYHQTSSYSSSLDYFTITNGAYYQYTLETFAKLESTLAGIFPLSNEKVAILKSGTMSTLKIHNYFNKSTMGSITDSFNTNVNTYLYNDESAIQIGNKKVIITDPWNLYIQNSNIVINDQTYNPTIYAGDNITITAPMTSIGAESIAKRKITPTVSGFQGSINYVWTLNGKVVSNSKSINHPTAAGVYTYIVTATDNYNHTSSDYIIITINP